MSQGDLLQDAYYERELAVKCLEICQPIGKFYVGYINSKDLREITYSDVRRMEGERGFESYLGIQRPLSQKRVKDISSYARTQDACFPTGVILSVRAACAEFDPDSCVMTLTPYKSSDPEEDSVKYQAIAKVLDGQHRIAGLANYDGEDFDINVSIFVDIDVSSEAYIFSTVNLAQTKVTKSLTYDLYELATSRSPQKLCHEIAVALDDAQESPFYSRIKRLGSAQSHNLPGSITQAAFVESLMRYLSSNPLRDRDTYLRGRKPSLNEGDLSKLIFRKFMINEQDFDLTDIIWDYFSAVEQRWPQAWNSNDKGVMLSKTNGFMALMRFLGDCYKKIGVEKPSQIEFDKIFKMVKLKDDDFTIENFKPGSSGSSALYRELKNSVPLVG